MGISFLVVLVTVNLDLALVERVETELVEDAAADEETSAVGGGVVGQTDWDTVAWELMSVSGADNNVTLETSISDLGDDVLVGDADYQSVFWGVVLVLVLDTQALTGEVVGLTLASSSEFDLVTLEVGLVLLNGNEGLLSASTAFLGRSGR